MADVASPHGAEPVTRPAWVLLIVLTLLNILNMLDRQLIASLAPLLIQDLGLTRAEIGLLVGFAFVVLYTAMGVVLGVAADRLTRVRLIAGGLGLWSAMTGASGLARNFFHLAVPRVLVGVGEATLTPAALSMLGDVFPRQRLGTATGIYYAGIPVGTALSLAVAGWVAPRYGWRTCFFALGLAGLAAVAGVLFLREPARRRPAGAATAPRPSLRAIMDLVAAALRTRPALWLTILGGSLLVYASGAALHGVTWLVQERGFSFSAAAYTSSAVAVFTGLVGNSTGGWFSDWCARRWDGGRHWSLVAMTLGFLPFTLAFYLVPPTSPFFYGCWIVASAAVSAWFGPVFSAVQELSPAAARSTVIAVALLVLNLLGVGPGSWITGLIGDAQSLTAGLSASLAVSTLAVVPLSLAARAEARHARATRGGAA